MGRKLFGTDGIRGVANIEPMTAEMMVRLGRAAAHVFKERKSGRHRIVIGKDTRLSGYMLENALASGICSMGVDILLVGPLPTPGIAFITSSMRADAGVVISASHNPYQDNGIKFFDRDGFKLPDEVEAEIEEHIFNGELDHVRPTAEEVGKAFRVDDAVGRYVVYLKSTFPSHLTLEGIRIVVDCANGAAYRVAPAVFEELGAEVIPIGIHPDGSNINADCGSLHPECVAEEVRARGAHLGIALDGDADRVIVVDEHGNEVDGDHIMAICARDLQARGRLKGGAVVATVMSNLGLERSLAEVGLGLVRTRVGDRYVVERMRADGYNFGGEQSGHLVFLDHATTGDGVLAALQLLAVVVGSGKPLSELARVMEAVPQVLQNVRVREKRPVEDLPGVQRVLRAVEAELGRDGRVLVRYSGTEPKLRVMVEGDDEDRIRAMAAEICEAVRREIGEEAA
ncbi:MAG: phosphoglucosamine mutase [Candidatus Dadabacteria bacterium]|nr:MAG: phosphoglucosamine mutase [Candidatus Dadabacteria bacterium]